MLVKVKGGTDAGKRKVVALPPWVCWCDVDEESGRHDRPPHDIGGYLYRPGDWYSCCRCGARNPNRS